MSQVAVLIEYPPGQASTFARGWRYLMLDKIAPETHEFSGGRQNLQDVRGKIHLQLAAVFFCPVLVQVTDGRYFSVVVFFELIEMAFVK